MSVPVVPVIALRTLAPAPAPVPLPPHPRPVHWRVHGQLDHAAARYLSARTGNRAATAVVLGDAWRPADTATLLTAVEAARHRREPLVLVHTGAGGASLLRTLAAEHRDLVATAIEVDSPAPELAGRPAMLAAVAALAAAPTGVFDELRVDSRGGVSRPAWQPAALPSAAPRFGGCPVVVTGGLGGLGIRIAAALASCGATPILLDSRREPELSGDTVRYLRWLRRIAPASRVVTVDLTDPVATRAALAGLAPRAVVHCAGRITGGTAGGTARRLSPHEVDTLVAAKVQTLRSIFTALDAATTTTDADADADADAATSVRAVVAFGSVTARTAHPGLAGYALANELLRREVRRLATTHGYARWRVLEWSLWSGAGMARRVARDVAPRLGMVPVPVATGVAATVRLVAALADAGDVSTYDSLVVAGAWPGREGARSGRPEGLPGIDAALVVPPGADLDRISFDVASAALPPGAVELVRESRTGTRRRRRDAAGTSAVAAEALLLRASLTGDRVECEVRPACSPDSGPIRRYHFAVRPAQP